MYLFFMGRNEKLEEIASEIVHLHFNTIKIVQRRQALKPWRPPIYTIHSPCKHNNNPPKHNVPQTKSHVSVFLCLCNFFSRFNSFIVSQLVIV